MAIRSVGGRIEQPGPVRVRLFPCKICPGFEPFVVLDSRPVANPVVTPIARLIDPHPSATDAGGLGFVERINPVGVRSRDGRVRPLARGDPVEILFTVIVEMSLRNRSPAHDIEGISIFDARSASSHRAVVGLPRAGVAKSVAVPELVRHDRVTRSALHPLPLGTHVGKTIKIRAAVFQTDFRELHPDDVVSGR